MSFRGGETVLSMPHGETSKLETIRIQNREQDGRVLTSSQPLETIGMEQ